MGLLRLGPPLSTPKFKPSELSLAVLVLTFWGAHETYNLKPFDLPAARRRQGGLTRAQKQTPDGHGHGLREIHDLTSARAAKHGWARLSPEAISFSFPQRTFVCMMQHTETQDPHRQSQNSGNGTLCVPHTAPRSTFSLLIMLASLIYVGRLARVPRSELEMVTILTATIYPAPTMDLASFTCATLLIGDTLPQKRGLRVRVARSLFHSKQLPPDLSRFRACAFPTLPCTLEGALFSSLLRNPFIPLTQKMLWGKVSLEKEKVEESLSGGLRTKRGHFLSREARERAENPKGMDSGL